MLAVGSLHSAFLCSWLRIWMLLFLFAFNHTGLDFIKKSHMQHSPALCITFTSISPYLPTMHEGWGVPFVGLCSTLRLEVAKTFRKVSESHLGTLISCKFDKYASFLSEAHCWCRIFANGLILESYLIGTELISFVTSSKRAFLINKINTHSLLFAPSSPSTLPNIPCAPPNSHTHLWIDTLG